MKFLLVRERTVKALDFYEAEGKDALEASFKPGRKIDTVLVSDRSTACSAMIVDDEKTKKGIMRQLGGEEAVRNYERNAVAEISF